ncbi:MAG: NrdH-redoxin [Betaproteobacteria bacterium]|nr:MAG: NrdH-redoxin [Betaproteobacteria bacterium]
MVLSILRATTSLARASLLILITVIPQFVFAAPNTIEMWGRQGCPYCAEAKDYLAELQTRRPQTRVIYYDVVRDSAARERFVMLNAAHQVTRPGVPAFLVGDHYLIGWSATETPREIEAILAGKPLASAGHTQLPNPALSEIDPARLGLPLFTATIGLLDGFNPCAMWVLVFVLSLLVNLKDRSKVLLIGGTFILTSGIVYFAFMAAWLNVFLLVGVSRVTQIILGMIAMAIGVFNVKDYFALGYGVSLSIPESAKPAIYIRARQVLRAESIGAALGAVIVLAVMVNMVEFLCTSGLPAVYTQVLASRNLPAWQYYAYLALYNVFYMLDDALLLAAAVATLRITKLQERGGRVLKLISGVVMLLLGFALAVRPDWLEWTRFGL